MNDDLFVSRLTGEGGDVAEMILNRPKALNALTLAMCQTIRENLKRWEHDTTIKAVIIRSSSDRAFCAGGDVRSLYEYRLHPSEAMRFFSEEYAMNTTLFHFSKPYVALLDGITMGGGAGISLHGSHPVATEHFSLAMPETAIGFFPDIGAGYFLNRCLGKFGYYLGLSGVTIKVEDAVALGLVQHTVWRQKLPDLMKSLRAIPLGDNPKQKVTAIIQAHSFNPAPSTLLSHQALVDVCFSKPTVEEIFLMLEADGSAWSQALIRLLQTRSPTSLVVTLDYLRRTQAMTFDEVMALNLVLAKAFMHSHDFFEGVRAVLVDKDQAPRWQPDTLSEVNDRQW